MNLVSHILAPEAETSHDDLLWRLLHYFNIYRIMLGGLFLVATSFLGGEFDFGTFDPKLFLYASAAYLAVGLAFILPIAWRKPDFNAQLAVQVCLDIVFIVILMHASGGIQSGLGLLLLVSLAASGLIRQGRMMLFFASLTCIAILLEHTYDLLYFQPAASHYVLAGMLSIGYFVMGGLMRVLAQSSRENVELARRRGADLASMEKINHRVIQELQDGILVVDGSGKILSWNLQAESLLALNGAALLDANLDGEVPQIARLWHARGENGREDLLATAGSGRRIRVRFAPVDGGCSVIFLEDWSRIQNQARQIKLAALGRLTANIAHEIRNPLASITYAADLLAEDAAAEPMQSRLISIILENSKRLDSMVQDILRFNRKDSANAEIFSPESFFPDFLDQFCRIHKVSRESFVLELKSSQNLVFDRSHLNQVMWNLSRNAWRHSRKQAESIRIRIGRGSRPDRMDIDIMDDGPGVAESLQAELFEPFFTTSEGGTGLGLYIAREISAANGATLDYVGDSPGGHFRIECRGADVDQA